MREADIPGRDLPPPGEPFPGWELVAPMLRPRNASVFSLLERPIVIWDEPEQVQSARQAPLEAPGADRALAGLRSRPRLLPLGGTGAPGARRAASRFPATGYRMVAIGRETSYAHLHAARP